MAGRKTKPWSDFDSAVLATGPCLDENKIAALFDKELSADEIAVVDRHVERCGPCRAQVADYAATFGGDLGSGEVDAPPRPTAATSAADDELLQRWLARSGPLRRVGSTLREKWSVEALLGSGGMGDVYAATHRNGRRVALKVLRPELAALPVIVDRFLREGLVANKVGHPGAVTVLDEDRTEDGAPFLVMELLEGETLATERAREGRLDPWSVLRVAEEVLDVLAAAHAQGIVHRDLKPENLFRTREGAIKVLDFGIARLREVHRPNGVTEPGVMLGTPSFMPPEQARGESDAIDGRTDIWALGACLFSLMTDAAVHVGATPNIELLSAMTERAKPIRALRPDVPPVVADIVDRALAFDPKDRFPDARAMQTAVRDALAHATRAVATEAPPALAEVASVSQPERAPKRRIASPLIVAAALLLGGTFAFRHWQAAKVSPVPAPAVTASVVTPGPDAPPVTITPAVASEAVSPPAAPPSASHAAHVGRPRPSRAPQSGASASGKPVPSPARPAEAADDIYDQRR